MADKIKKLSEAIRVGATFRPQCYGYMFRNEKSCALGGAAEAVGLICDNRNETDTMIELVIRFPELTNQVSNPAMRDFGTLRSIIMYLNDRMKWSREMISDWVRSLGL